jgi:VWFA-related protein
MTFFMNQKVLAELARIVAAIASMPTSRTVIFISDGFNRFPGRELYAILMGYGPKDRSFQLHPRDTRPELDAVLKIATANNVKFYTIDSRGLYAGANVAGNGFDASTPSPITAGAPDSVISYVNSAARESSDVLAELARETGGVFFENNNDLMKGISQAVADGRQYYVLTYVPENNALDGKYRKIEVRVKGGNWQVHAKAGYWARTSE